QKLKMSSVKAASAKYSVPLLANSGDNWMLLTEASVFSEKDTYCASHLSTSAGTRNLKFAFGKGSTRTLSMTYNEDGIVHTPWRVAVLADNLNDIVNSSMTYSLNPEANKTLYKNANSWIKTGTVAWSWWSESGDDPIEFDQQKDYIDFAAENGWEYVCLDFGWCLWADYKAKVKELVDYASKKNVGILLWYGVNNDNHAGFKDAEGKAAYPKYSLRTTAQLEEQFSWCENVGVKGVKVDYYENDGKNTMTQMYECATIAAKHKINVLFHGCTAPRGEMRTFPNVLGYEAVRGSEYYKWNVGPSVSNCLTYVYNRNVVGGMDFTPVGTQIDQLPVTAGFQLAQVIAYETGLQNMASSVYKLEGYNGLSMINDVPTQWDETRLLGGYPGKDVSIARRSGENWYIAAMTAAAKTEKISLDFLGDGTYKAYIYKDNNNGTDVVIETKDVTKQSQLNLVLADNGGATVRISKEAMNTTTLYSQYDYYEAESANNQISGNAAVGKNQFASGMKQVTGLGGTKNNHIIFNKIQAPEDGIYEMRLYYACGVNRRVVYSINDEEEICSCHLNAGVNTLAMQKFYVKLKKGQNVISFGNASAKAPNIDRIAISKMTVDQAATKTDLTDDGESVGDGPLYDYTLYGCNEAVLAGGAIIENGAVSWLGASAGSSATFYVHVDKTGKYKLQINYYAGETRDVHVSVNGGEEVIYSCQSTGSYTMDSMESMYGDVYLEEGENTIRLGNATPRATGCAGQRRATEFRPALTIEGIISLFGKITVKGPGQNASAKR
ncbi:MAG: glycoside hydrolase family 97 catalytic domain-containing protein, partial [Eubacterium sp.]|nr:glycoside hydrolase family 97 catalytic domain-containing protein [Eubacterium sp.]